jgi:2,4-dienoyl-CoA reductase [(3E)-enoyl-CoA-producing], peroxisomal
MRVTSTRHDIYVGCLSERQNAKHCHELLVGADHHHLLCFMSTIMASSPFTPNCLNSKVALVTGGGSGICFEVTRQLLLHGCSGAVICGRRSAFLMKAVSILELDTGKVVKHFQLDVRDSEACAKAVEYTVEQFGRLDIVVNGAAGNFLSEASALSPKGFKTVMEIDTQGTYNMCHASYQALRSNGGVVVNISATLHYGATWFQAHASAAKSAVDSLTRTLALEWGVDQIRVVGIAPGPIANTPGTTKLAPGMEDGDVVSDMVKEGIPLGRMGTTADIGLAAVYLCSEAGSYVTGHVLVVDGGQWLYRPPMVPREMVAELSRQVEAKSRAQGPKSKL